MPSLHNYDRFLPFNELLISKEILPGQTRAEFLGELGELAVTHGDSVIEMQTIPKIQESFMEWVIGVKTVGNGSTTVFIAERNLTPRLETDLDVENYMEAGHRIIGQADDKVKIVSKFPPKGSDLLAIVNIELLEARKPSLSEAEQTESAVKYLAVPRGKEAKMMEMDSRDLDQIIDSAIKQSGLSKAEFIKTAYQSGNIDLNLLPEAPDTLELSDREITLLVNIFESTHALSKILGIKSNIVTYRRKDLVDKLGVPTIVQAYIQGLRLGYIRADDNTV